MGDGKYFCPCCGHRTLEEDPPGTHLICEICFWEDDPVPFGNPDCAGGANRVSLLEGRRNYLECSAREHRFIEDTRSQGPDDERDPRWRLRE